MHRSALLLALALGLRMASAANLEGAPPIQWDEQLHQNQQAVISLYVETRECMVETGHAFLSKGVRQPQALVYFMAKTCGDPFAQKLMRDGMREERARQMIADMATRSLYHDILRQAIPRSGPAASAPVEPNE